MWQAERASRPAAENRHGLLLQACHCSGTLVKKSWQATPGLPALAPPRRPSPPHDSISLLTPKKATTPNKKYSTELGLHSSEGRGALQWTNPNKAGVRPTSWHSRPWKVTPLLPPPSTHVVSPVRWKSDMITSAYACSEPSLRRMASCTAHRTNGAPRRQPPRIACVLGGMVTVPRAAGGGSKQHSAQAAQHGYIQHGSGPGCHTVGSAGLLSTETALGWRANQEGQTHLQRVSIKCLCHTVAPHALLHPGSLELLRHRLHKHASKGGGGRSRAA